MMTGSQTARDKFCLLYTSGQDQKKWFTNEQWRDVFAEVQQWFSGLEVVGWFLSNPGFPVQLTEELRTLHEKHFPSDKHVLFLMDVMENDADFFIKSDVGLTAAPGYYLSLIHI